MAARHAPADVRRAQFFKAALESCAEKGYHATRMDDIAARAGLSKGSLYHHFESKEQLFLALVESFVDHVELALAEDRQHLGSARAALRHLYLSIDEMVGDDPVLLRGLAEFALLAMRNDEFRVHFTQRYDAFVERVCELLRWGIERGEFDPAMDIERTARLIVIGGDGMALLYVALDRYDRFIHDADELLDALFRGNAPGALASRDTADEGGSA